MKHNCNHCHTCGCRLLNCLDGEEYCSVCGQYRRYQSHGWSRVYGENSPCPDRPVADTAKPKQYTDTWTTDDQAEFHIIGGET